MRVFDVCIAGSGPGGVFAARALRGLDILILDPGLRPGPEPRVEENLYDLRARSEDLFPLLIGDRWQSFRNLHEYPPVSLKLKAPRTAYIIDGWERETPVESSSFHPMISLAEGGLANGWGAGVYRYTDAELASIPCPPGEMKAAYDEVCRHIGVSGEMDDLAGDFGDEPDLQPPLRLSRNATSVLERYARHRDRYRAEGVRIGRPRLAVLTKPHLGREPYAYRSLEFFQQHDPAVYNPAYTLREMVAGGEAGYESGWLVESYRETEGVVEVKARRLGSQETRTVLARHLLLAAGALNTTRIVLAAAEDYETRTPLLDNSMACLPLIHPTSIGSAIDTHESTLAQLNVIADHPALAAVCQASFYGSTGPLRAELIGDFPLSVGAALEAGRLLAPAISLLMVFFPGVADPGNWLRLKPGGALEASLRPRTDRAALTLLTRVFRRLGCRTWSRLWQYPKPGASLHYAGTLPMLERPRRYETHPDGRLEGTRGVYVVDGACLPSLPAKNLTLTIMANALRIGQRLRETLR